MELHTDSRQDNLPADPIERSFMRPPLSRIGKSSSFHGDSPGDLFIIPHATPRRLSAASQEEASYRRGSVGSHDSNRTPSPSYEYVGDNPLVLNSFNSSTESSPCHSPVPPQRSEPAVSSIQSRTNGVQLCKQDSTVEIPIPISRTGGSKIKSFSTGSTRKLATSKFISAPFRPKIVRPKTRRLSQSYLDEDSVPFADQQSSIGKVLNMFWLVPIVPFMLYYTMKMFASGGSELLYHVFLNGSGILFVLQVTEMLNWKTDVRSVIPLVWAWLPLTIPILPFVFGEGKSFLNVYLVEVLLHVANIVYAVLPIVYIEDSHVHSCWLCISPVYLMMFFDIFLPTYRQTLLPLLMTIIVYMDHSLHLCGDFMQEININRGFFRLFIVSWLAFTILAAGFESVATTLGVALTLLSFLCFPKVLDQRIPQTTLLGLFIRSSCSHLFAVMIMSMYWNWVVSTLDLALAVMRAGVATRIAMLVDSKVSKSPKHIR